MVKFVVVMEGSLRGAIFARMAPAIVVVSLVVFVVILVKPSSPGGFVVQEYHSGEAGERHRAGDRCDIGRRVRSDPWRKVSALGTIKVNEKIRNLP